MPNEKLFRFNPFQIKDWDEKQIYDTYMDLEGNLYDMDAPSALAHDIEIYANIGYLVGELIARYTELVSNAEVTLKVKKSDMLYKLRDNWLATKDEKAPAIDYFTSKVNSMYLDEEITLNGLQARLQRFKYAYASIESKQNALKRRLDAIKFDTFNQ